MSDVEHRQFEGPGHELFECLLLLSTRDVRFDAGATDSDADLAALHAYGALDQRTHDGRVLSVRHDELLTVGIRPVFVTDGRSDVIEVHGQLQGPAEVDGRRIIQAQVGDEMIDELASLCGTSPKPQNPGGRIENKYI